MRLRTVDLFCGAGGSSWGASNAGAQIMMGIDGWDKAIDSYNANFNGNGREFLMDPRTRPRELGIGKERVDLLLASPECTNHTCAKGSGERDEDSKRTANYVLNFAKDLEPRWIVIENVIHMKNWKGFAPLLKGLERLGYGYQIQVLDAMDFGVPQTRKRLFISCELGRRPDILAASQSRPVPVASVLDFNLDTNEDRWDSKLLISDRRAKPTIERFLRGKEELGSGVPFLIVYYGSDGAGGWQPLDRPLRTITTIDRFGLVTWKRGKPYLRMLQVPELRRAMGIADAEGFRLIGSRREQIMQLGNGVCPPVMQAMVKHLIGVQRKESGVRRSA